MLRSCLIDGEERRRRARGVRLDPVVASRPRGRGGPTQAWDWDGAVFHYHVNPAFCISVQWGDPASEGHLVRAHCNGQGNQRFVITAITFLIPRPRVGHRPRRSRSARLAQEASGARESVRGGVTNLSARRGRQASSYAARPLAARLQLQRRGMGHHAGRTTTPPSYIDLDIIGVRLKDLNPRTMNRLSANVP